ncbi:GNAT family acetyltransferase Nat4 [Aspergillus costaricaensis CBS 115574]|uniref:GNAT family acetyltransferase Nat4 n=1 Tax=Aspergillus costaricaensis CBS 115574 TaxID=1448317 RepID=A0ACD1I8C1_9EURO|nr:GNAT family acetyltransferase Nat4 [Aspergillus costaricaensis CBS 115574]RAK86748.1 GNAT family acetyltransferase Nat4 [Aspergillus costaricaensis CBS 115574]
MSSSVQAGRVTKNTTTTTTTTARRRRVQHPKKTQATSTKSQPHDHEYERDGSQYNPSLLSSLPLVERTNKLSIRKFTSEYITPEFLTYTYQPEPPSSTDEQRYKFSIHSAASIPTTDLNACFDLIEETSSEAYRNSSTGWSPSKKKKEMKLPDMKYLVVRREELTPSDGEGDVVGFMSFMITYEDGKEVVYLYEIHLSSEVQKQGLGKRLLLVLMEIGRRVGVEKAMLTVFTSNGVAQRLYEAIGFDTDEYSPRPRRLRNGMVKEPDYRIMSVRLNGGPYV